VRRTLPELLHAAADDPNRPLGFTIDEVVALGRRRTRLRAWGWTSAWAAAAVAVLIVLSQLMTTGERPPFPAPPPSPTPSTAASAASVPTTPTSSTAPPLSAADQQLVADCGTTVIYLPQSVSIDPSHPPTTMPEPNPTTSDLSGWRVLLRADDQFGTSAGLVSGDGTQYAVCNRVHDASSDHREDLLPMKPPQNGPVPSSWTDPANEHLVDTPFGWSQICQKKPSGKVCPDELYFGVGVAYQGVARVHIEWPDKTSSDYPVVNGYYVARHLEKRVDRPVDPKVRDMQPLPPLFISFYDAAGQRLIRYNHNPPYLVPATCPTDHGC
jgi:hypothetical protein